LRDAVDASQSRNGTYLDKVSGQVCRGQERRRLQQSQGYVGGRIDSGGKPVVESIRAFESAAASEEKGHGV